MSEEKKSPEQIIADYKENQKKNIAGYKIGAIDSNGYKITKVFVKGEEYVIYEIDTPDIVDSLKVWINTQIEEDSIPIDNFGKVRVKFAKVKGLLYKVIDKTTTKTLIAHILSNAIRGNGDSANDQFDELMKEIDLEYKEQFNNRMRSLLASFVFSILVIVFATLTYSKVIDIKSEYIHDLIYVVAGGSVGGFFSISIGINKIVSEKDVEWWLYVLYGIERMSIAIMASVIIYFAIKADLVFSICKKSENPLFSYIVFSIVAGFSETLVPSLLTQLEKGKGA